MSDFISRFLGGQRDSGVLVCDSCQITAELLRPEHESDRVRCPNCGIIDDLEEAQILAARHLQQPMIEGLRRGFARDAARSKHVKYVRGSTPSLPTPRFVFKPD